MQERSIEIEPGRALSLFSAGTRAPTVVFETGLLAGTREWLPLAEEVSRTASVCCYDRAGRGSSDPGPLPRDARSCAGDLHRLLPAAALPAPYLLVGHSLGGFIVRLYAATWPERVCGVILVDASHDEQFDQISRTLPPATEADPPGLTTLRRFWSKDYRFPDRNAEGFDFPASFRQVHEAPLPPAMPLTVISAGSSWADLGVSRTAQAELQQISADLQLQLLALSSNSRHVIAPGSSHFVQRDAPDLIVREVLRMVESCRSS